MYKMKKEKRKRRKHNKKIIVYFYYIRMFIVGLLVSAFFSVVAIESDDWHQFIF
jgi:hypothetical protein